MMNKHLRRASTRLHEVRRLEVLLYGGEIVVRDGHGRSSPRIQRIQRSTAKTRVFFSVVHDAVRHVQANVSDDHFETLSEQTKFPLGYQVAV